MGKPKHKAARKFIISNFFKELKTFEGLEKEIESLPSSQLKGEAFEVFSEAYITTSKLLNVREVWPFDELPELIKEKLKLNIPRDMGIDGAYENNLGEIVAYQAKFRSGRARLNWKKDLSTFIGLGDQCKYKFLITNANDLPELLSDRVGFFSSKGFDLDLLEEKDFKAIYAWLHQESFQPPLKKPRSHQKDAVDAITKHLQSNSRATAVMACGTGKSLVALWAKEKARANSCLVLVPSIALVRQLLHEWSHNSSEEVFSYLCVCSDKSVTHGSDNASFLSSELDFPVTTNIDDIRSYLLSKTAKKLIFCTYQSSSVLMAAAKECFTFDLIIFDEAHKTAGREGKKFGLALNDQNIKSHKRLFFTATPRHYRVNNKSSVDQNKAYSMDDPTIYGAVCYRLTFAEAALSKIICDYKVVISVITSDMVDRKLIGQATVEVGNSYTKAQQVANQLAIKETMEKWGVKKIFTFHKSIKSAKSFVSEECGGIRNFIPSLNVYHVNGDIKASKRERIINQFSESEFGLISNSRCLTEGVDVPAVDLVAFMSPKRSRIDVVQAAGRAMRRNGDKQVGYILIPIYLEAAHGESLSDAINDTDFDEVYDVLNALQEQDENLYLSICNMRENIKLSAGYNDNRFKEVVNFTGPDIALSELESSITAKIITKLAPLWHQRFAELKEFYYEFGHTEVPRGWSKNPPLAHWVRTQRSLSNAGALEAERIEKLSSIHFVWRVNENRWHLRFAEFKTYVKEQGNCSLQKEAMDAGLYSWVKTQVRDYLNGSLSKERYSRLDALGLSWEPASSTSNWDENYLKLKNHFLAYGHSSPPTRNPTTRNYSHLGIWAVSQRGKYKDDLLAPEQIKLLNELDFSWSRRGDVWEEKFAETQEFYQTNGHIALPPDAIEYKSLRSWLASQREAYKTYKNSDNPLYKDRANKLDQLDLMSTLRLSEISDTVWLNHLEELTKFIERKGHSSVTTQTKGFESLGNWVENQRSSFHNGSLPSHKSDLLSDYGFDFNQNKFSEVIEKQPNTKVKIAKKKQNTKIRAQTPFNVNHWFTMLEKFKSYVSNHHNGNVPVRYIDDPKLGRWLEYQRRQMKLGKLDGSRKRLLVEEGFELDSLKNKNNRITSPQWEAILKRFIEFSIANNQYSVPTKYEQDQQLANWCQYQRKAFRNGKLAEDKVKKLKNAHFLFEPANDGSYRLDRNRSHDFAQADSDLFNKMFLKVVQFKTDTGHLRLEPKFIGRGSLYQWVKTTRSRHRHGTLPDKQLKRLEDIGFHFEIIESNWNRNFQLLSLFKEEYGHSDVPQERKNRDQLATWVRNQRRKYKLGKMPDKHIKKFKEIDFSFEAYQITTPWEERFAELLTFKKQQGHVDVPQLFGGVTGLGKWVNRQRQSYAVNRLEKEKLELLQAIGFIWKKNPGQKPPKLK